MTSSYDAIIVGGGFAGGAMATVLARGGKSVLVLEKSDMYRDLVRGEWIAPWGVVESKRMGLYETLAAADGHHVPFHVEYGEGIDVAEAEAARLPLGFLPGVPGPLCIGHPAACNALNMSAVAAGAAVLRDVDVHAVTAGARPSVTYRHNGVEHTATARLIIGADGRNSWSRGHLGFTLHRDKPHHWFAGMLVEGANGWPDELETMGTEGDVQFFVFPQSQGKLRLYLSTPLDQKPGNNGDDRARRFLDAFRLKSVPFAEAITSATIAGPCSAIPNEDTWVDAPAGEGVVLIGDAAGYNDPITGQGLSIALRDVRIVSELLLGADTWDATRFAPYVEERRERMRRLRFTAAMDSMIHAEFGPEALKRRLAIRAKRASDPSFLMCQMATMVGPEMLPPEAFSESVWQQAASMGA